MSEIVNISTGYNPRPLQAEIHRNMKRFNVLAIHRRFGKTVLAVNELIDRGLNCTEPNPRMAYIAPFYKQAKAIAWDYLKEFTRAIPGAKSYESELRVDIPVGPASTCRIQLYGADHPDSLRGMYFDHTVFDEFGNQPLGIWTEVVRPALADRKGGATFLGTPNGKNHFHDIYQDAKQRMANGDKEWFAATYRADETDVIDPEELASAREGMPESDYRQEFLCDWAAAIKGAFYTDELLRLREKGQIVNVPHERRLPVHCAFDLGVDDSTAIWFIQFFQSEIRLIMYREWSNMGLVDVLADIRKFPYVYGELFMPWDINIRELSTGKTRLETVEQLGFTVNVAPKLPIADGINAVRTLLSHCWFDEIECADGLDCLESYRKKFDHRTGLFMDKPEHDKFSHGADSFRTLAVCFDPLFTQNVNTVGHATLMASMQKPNVLRST